MLLRLVHHLAVFASGRKPTVRAGERKPPKRYPEKPPAGPGPKKRDLHGLFPRNYPRSVRGFVDVDYVKSLTPEEKRWLSVFLDRHYGAKFGDAQDDQLPWSTDEKRKSYRDKNVANQDLWAKQPEEWLTNPDENTSDPRTPTDGPPPEEPPRVAECPAYLDTDEYRAALAEYRRHLAPGRRETTPEDTRAYRRAKLRLERIIAAGQSAAGLLEDVAEDEGDTDGEVDEV